MKGTMMTAAAAKEEGSDASMNDDTNTTKKSSPPTTARQDLIDILAQKIVKQFKDKGEKPLDEYVKTKLLPKDSKKIRDLPFYDTTFKAIQWQRDNYFVGPKYANLNRNPKSSLSSLLHTRMPLDATCLGHIQLCQFGIGFVPSSTTKEMLLPIVISLPRGSLYQPIVDAVSNAIPLGQPLLDSAVKHSLSTFLQDPQWRYVIKTQTQGYIGINPNTNNNNNGTTNSNNNDTDNDNSNSTN